MPHPVDIHVGKLVRIRRHELGLAQSGLAEAVGVSFQQVQKYERGDNRVSASMLVKIATALSVAPGYFLDEAPGALDHGALTGKDKALIQAATTPGAYDLIGHFAACDEEARTALVEIARIASGHRTNKRRAA